MSPQPADPAICYRTERGISHVGESLEWLRSLKDESVQLVLTSPPFPLTRKKSYGNVKASDYVAWFRPFADEVWRILKHDGSFVVELGSAWQPGQPVKSLYQFEVLLDLTKGETNRFELAQDFYWYNPARLPSPAQWVNIERIRVKDSVSPIWWFSKSTRPKANNSSILKAYSKAQTELFERGYNSGSRPSGWDISANGFSTNHGGAIPPNYFSSDNVLEIANTSSNDRYLRLCRLHGVQPHPARFPIQLPEFFIKFLTGPDDVVLDPFAGSNAVGAAAEALGREWLACEMDRGFAAGGAYRFMQLDEPRDLPNATGFEAVTNRNGKT